MRCIIDALHMNVLKDACLVLVTIQAGHSSQKSNVINASVLVDEPIHVGSQIPVAVTSDIAIDLKVGDHVTLNVPDLKVGDHNVVEHVVKRATLHELLSLHCTAAFNNEYKSYGRDDKHAIENLNRLCERSNLPSVRALPNDASSGKQTHYCGFIVRGKNTYYNIVLLGQSPTSNMRYALCFWSPTLCKFDLGQ